MKHLFKTAPVQSHYDSRINECNGVELHLSNENMKSNETYDFIRNNKIEGVHLPIDREGRGDDLYQIESLIYRYEELMGVLEKLSELDFTYLVIHFSGTTMSLRSDLLRNRFKRVLNLFTDKDVYLENVLPFEYQTSHLKFCPYHMGGLVEFVEFFKEEGFSNLGILLDIQHHHSYLNLLSIIQENTTFNLDKLVEDELNELSKHIKAVHISGYDNNLSLKEHGISLEKTPNFTKAIASYLSLFPYVESIIYEVYELDYTKCDNAKKSMAILKSGLNFTERGESIC